MLSIFLFIVLLAHLTSVLSTIDIIVPNLRTGIPETRPVPLYLMIIFSKVIDKVKILLIISQTISFKLD